MKYANLIELNGEVILDLTKDTVTPDKLAYGATAHDANGKSIIGIAPIGDAELDLSQATVALGEDGKVYAFVNGQLVGVGVALEDLKAPEGGDQPDTPEVPEGVLYLEPGLYQTGAIAKAIAGDVEGARAMFVKPHSELGFTTTLWDDAGNEIKDFMYDIYDDLESNADLVMDPDISAITGCGIYGIKNIVALFNTTRQFNIKGNNTLNTIICGGNMPIFIERVPALKDVYYVGTQEAWNTNVTISSVGVREDMEVHYNFVPTWSMVDPIYTIDYTALEPGLYEAGTTTMKYSWDELVANDTFRVSDVEYEGEPTKMISLGERLAEKRSNWDILDDDCIAGVLVFPSLSDSMIFEDGDDYGNGKFLSESSVLEGVVLPAALRYVPMSCFWCSSDIKVIAFAENSRCKFATFNSFGHLDALKSIVLPESITWLGMQTFGNCISLESVVLPVSLTRMSYYVFEDCYNLKTVTYSGTSAQWNTIMDNISDTDDGDLRGAWCAHSCITSVYCEGDGVTIPVEQSPDWNSGWNQDWD